MQGVGGAGRGNTHPKIVNVSLKVTTGCPETRTLVFVVTGKTCPPWGQITIAPMCKRRLPVRPSPK